LLLARLLTLALFVAIAASPFGRAPLGAPVLATDHAHCPGHTSEQAPSKVADARGHHGHAYGPPAARLATDEAAQANSSVTTPVSPKGDPGCCLTAVGVQQAPVAAPLPVFFAAQKMAPLNDAAIADMTPDGPQRPPRTTDHA
jgi:hypothetical protein